MELNLTNICLYFSVKIDYSLCISLNLFFILTNYFKKIEIMKCVVLKNYMFGIKLLIKITKIKLK